MCLYCTLQVASACSVWSLSWKQPKPPQLQSTKTKLTEPMFLLALFPAAIKRWDEPALACGMSQCHQRAQPTVLHTPQHKEPVLGTAVCLQCLLSPSIFYLSAQAKTYTASAALTHAGETAYALSLVKKMKSLCVAGSEICHTLTKFESPAKLQPKDSGSRKSLQ